MRTNARIGALVVASVMVAPTGLLFTAPALAKPSAIVASGGPPDNSHPRPGCGYTIGGRLYCPPHSRSGQTALERCGVGFAEAVVFGGIAAVIAGPWGWGIIRVAFGAGVANCVRYVLQ